MKRTAGEKVKVIVGEYAGEVTRIIGYKYDEVTNERVGYRLGIDRGVSCFTDEHIEGKSTTKRFTLKCNECGREDTAIVDRGALGKEPGVYLECYCGNREVAAGDGVESALTWESSGNHICANCGSPYAFHESGEKCPQVPFGKYAGQE